jgi:predicted Fe-Mo cluster-binding NifX family protein
MRLAVVSEGEELSSYVSDDFGHAPFFLLVDYDSLDFEVIVNEFIDAEGAGMKVAQALTDLNVDVVLTGGIGGHGRDILEKAGIEVSTDEDGTVEECIEGYKRRLEKRKEILKRQEQMMNKGKSV